MQNSFSCSQEEKQKRRKNNIESDLSFNLKKVRKKDLKKYFLLAQQYQYSHSGLSSLVKYKKKEGNSKASFMIRTFIHCKK